MIGLRVNSGLCFFLVAARFDIEEYSNPNKPFNKKK
jgi:hypothetical protein